MSDSPEISIAGTGNVAFHLGKALSPFFTIKYVLGRDEEKGNHLAEILNTRFTSSRNDLKGSDLIICCYSDDALKEELPALSKIASVVSTSGTIDVLSFEHTEPTGVFYPLQSFSGSEEISFKDLPVFIEASSPELKSLLFHIASKIGAKSVEMTAEERVKLHIAAVFTNNFTNHIIDLAQQFSSENGIDYNYLMPLLRKTFEKLQHNSAGEIQTGPARRNDTDTIKKHLDLLDGDKKKIYQLLSESIQKQNS